MRVHNVTASVVFKAILVGFVVYGVGDAFLHPSFGVPPLRYFTIQSNILLGLVVLRFLIRELGGHDTNTRLDAYLRGCILLAISVTGLVFHLLLAPLVGTVSFQSHVLHTIVPLGFVVDWVVFAPKDSFRLKDVPVWVAYPLAYLGINLVTARFDGFYPYEFMDASKLGYGGVAINTVLLLAAFGLLGAAYVGIGRVLARRARPMKTSAEVSPEQMARS
ncbi:MAG: Pr6Pr family membrane protein [Actinobacteria bacterium]|nr:Pr6Pr family membrane protein [Actinomycetota bacterium]